MAVDAGRIEITAEARTEQAVANLQALQANLSNVSKSLSTTNSRLTGLIPGGNAASEVFGRLRGGVYQLIQGLSASAFRGAAETFSAIVKNGKETVAALEKTNVAFTTFLGSEEKANQLANKIARDAVTTPFDISGLAQATQKLTMITREGALAEETILNLGKAVTAAGGGDEQLSRLSVYLQQIGINAKVTQRQLNAFGTAGVNILQMVYDKFGDVYGFTLEGTKEWLQNISNPFEVLTQAINAAGDEGGEFADVYERMRYTIEQLNANLNDSIGIFGKIVGEQSGIIDKYKDILKELINQFNRPEVIGTFAETIRKLTQSFNGAGIIKSFFDSITKVLAAFNSGQFDNVIIFFKTLFNTLKQFSGISIVATILKRLLYIFTDPAHAEYVQNLAKAIGSFIAIVLQTKMVVTVSKYLTNFIGVIRQVGAQMKVMAASTMGWVGIIVGVVATIASLTGIFNSLGDVFGSTSDSINNATNNVSKQSYSTSKAIQDSSEDAADSVGAAGDSMVSKMEDVYEELAKLQAEWVDEMHDLGAFDFVEQVEQYRYFASLYASGTKARLALDEKVHEAELSLSKEIINLTEEFNDKFNEAYKSAKDYYDMFEYTQVVLTRTTASVIEGLNRQNDNMTKYYENLKKMSEMGFDEDFMSYVYEAGMDAATEVSGLADATSEQIEEINNLWRTRGQVATDIAVLNTKKLKEETLNEVAYLQTGLETQVVNVYDSGTLLVSSFTEGIRNSMPTLEDAIRNVASSAGDALGGITVDTSQFKADLDDLGENYSGLIDQLDVETTTFMDVIKAAFPVLGLSIVATTVMTFGKIKKEVKDATKDISKTIKDTTQKTLDDIYYAIFQVSNWDRVYRQTMESGMDDTVKNIARMLDMASANQIVTTQEAIQAVSDIAMNGLNNVSDTSLEIIARAEQGINDGVYKVAYDKQRMSVNQAEQQLKKFSKNMEAETGVSAEFVKKAYTNTAKEVEKATDNISKNVEKTVDKSTSKMGKMFSGLGKKFSSGFKSLSGLFSGVSPEISGALDAAADGLDTVTGIVDDVQRKAKDVGNLFGDLPLFKVPKPDTSAISESFVEIKDKAKAGMESVVNTTKEAAKGVAESAGNTVKESLGKVNETATTEMGKVAETTKQGATKAVDGLKGPLSGAAKWFSGLMSNIQVIIDSFLGIIFNTIKTVINGILDILNSAAGGIMKIIETIVGGIGKALAALLEPLSNPKLLLGVVALAGIAASIGILAIALKQFNEVGWDSLVKGGVAIAEFGVVCAGLAFISPAIAIGAAAITAMSVSLLAFGEGLKNISNGLDSIGSISKAVNMDVIEDALAAVKKINDGFDKRKVANLTNNNQIKRISQSILYTVQALNSVCVGIINIQIDQNGLENKISDILKVVDVIANINFSNSLNQMFRLGAAEQVAKISSVVVNIIEQVVNMIDKLNEAKAKIPANSKDTVQSLVGDCINIVVAIAKFEDKDDHSLNTDKEDWSSGLVGVVENIGKVATQVNKIIESISGLITKLQSIHNAGISEKQIDEYISDALSYVDKIGNFRAEDNSTLQGKLSSVTNNTINLSANAAKLAKSVGEVVQNLALAILELKKLKDAGIENIDGYIENINTYVGKLSNIKIDADVKATAEKAASMKDLVGNVKEILANLTGMLNEFDKFNQQYGHLLTQSLFDGEGEGDYIKQINDIIKGCEKIEITSDTLKDVADKSTNLSTLVSNVKSVIENVATLVKTIQEKTAQLDENVVDSAIKKINKIIAIICGKKDADGTEWGGIKAENITISQDTVNGLGNVASAVEKLADISNKVGNVKDIANKEGAVTRIINFIKDTLQKIPETLNAFGDDYQAQGEYYANRFIMGWNLHYVEMNDIGENIIARILEGMYFKFPEVELTGQQMQNDYFVAGIKSKFDSDKTAGSDMVAKVSLGIISSLKSMLSNGKSVADSFAQGIVNNLSVIEEAGKSMANALSKGYNAAIKPLTYSVNTAKAWSAQGGNVSNSNVNVIQNNNIYNELDMNSALNNLTWDVSRAL